MKEDEEQDVELHLWPAIIGGLAGGTVMSLMMKAAKKMGITQMDMALIEGAMFTGDRSKAEGIGTVMHLFVMSALVVGSIYGLLFAAFSVAPSQAWWVGALFGVGHGLIAGVMMPVLPVMHPRMGEAAAGAGGGLHLRPPGPFATNYGKLTPAGMMMSHIAYGLVLGAVYALLV